MIIQDIYGLIFLKNKSDAVMKFLEWKALIENQTGRRIKKLRTDNGLEFCSDEFSDYCRKHGIGRHKTVPHNPQQNGLAERMNRTILERVRCLLIYSGLPKSFWGEAVVTATYLINRCPSSAIEYKTPIEVWSGRTVSYGNLRIFGCVAYAHIKQDKLEPRARRCIFLGYPDGVKGYKLMSIEAGNHQKFFISRDVIFKEDEMYKDTLKGKENDGQKEINSNNSESQVEVETSSNVQKKLVTQAAGEIEEAGQLEDEEEQEEADYQLTRDRARR